MKTLPVLLLRRRRLWLPPALLSALITCTSADDRFFPVTEKSRLGATSLGTPSSNEIGDIVFRMITSAQRSIRVIYGEDQLSATETAVLSAETVRTSSGTLAAFSTINASGQVLTYNLSGGFQIVQRMDWLGPNSYASQAIARAEPEQAPPNPFSFVSPIGALTDSGRVYFYGERTPLNQSALLKAIYGSDAEVEITTPALEAPLASTDDDYTSIDAYVACSSGGKYVVWRGTGPSGHGIYASAEHPGAAAADGFTNTGLRPSINEAGHLAFAATGAAGDGIFIRQANGVLRRAGNLSSGPDFLAPAGLMPASYPSSNPDRVALNEYGQVMFTALDAAGRRTVYTTTLGRCRPLLSVGDVIQLAGNYETVAAIGIFDGLKKNGQGFLWASTGSGKEFLIRSSRGFNQAKLNDTPFSPSYRDTKYLLRSIPEQEAALNAPLVAKGKPVPTGRIRAIGCNLTSTANLLTAYGYNVSPGEIQDWLLRRWAAPPPGRKSSDYIAATNDPMEGAVELYSQEHQALIPLAPVVRSIGTHDPSAQGAMTNFQKLVDELRKGYPVKLRVPNGGYPEKDYEPFGHFVLAYGITDPGKTAPLTPEDILIHDPGNGGIYTLHDYGTRTAGNYDANHPGWMEDPTGRNKDKLKKPIRLYLYRPDISASPTLQLQLAVDTATVSGARPREVSGAQAYFLLTDAAGRRLGTGPNGVEYSEIPGGDYFQEEPYTGLDGDEGENDVAWEGYRLRHNLNLSELTEGSYTLTVTGVDSIQYSLSSGSTGSAPAIVPQSGVLSAGMTLVTRFMVGAPAGDDFKLGIERINASSAKLTLFGKAGTSYQLTSSADLQQWTGEGELRAGADAVLEWTVAIDSSVRRYYRVESTTP